MPSLTGFRPSSHPSTFASGCPTCIRRPPLCVSTGRACQPCISLATQERRWDKEPKWSASHLISIPLRGEFSLYCLVQAIRQRPNSNSTCCLAVAPSVTAGRPRSLKRRFWFCHPADGRIEACSRAPFRIIALGGLCGWAESHKATQKSHAKIGFPSGSRPPFIVCGRAFRPKIYPLPPRQSAPVLVLSKTTNFFGNLLKREIPKNT